MLQWRRFDPSGRLLGGLQTMELPTPIGMIGHRPVSLTGASVVRPWDREDEGRRAAHRQSSRAAVATLGGIDGFYDFKDPCGAGRGG